MFKRFLMLSALAAFLALQAPAGVLADPVPLGCDPVDCPPVKILR